MAGILKQERENPYTYSQLWYNRTVLGIPIVTPIYTDYTNFLITEV